MRKCTVELSVYETAKQVERPVEEAKCQLVVSGDGSRLCWLMSRTPTGTVTVIVPLQELHKALESVAHLGNVLIQ